MALTSKDWDNLLATANEQAVYGIFYDGICQLPDSLLPPKTLIYQLMIRIDNLERIHSRHNEQINQLDNFFKQEYTLPFQILKGQGIAAYYKHPSHRICGDIDLWFGDEQKAQKANQILLSNHINVTIGEYSDSAYWLNGIDIENHSRLIELHNPFIKKTIQEIEYNAFRTSNKYPPPSASLLLQITHILKHELNEGIGLRQICDLAVCLSKMDYDKQELGNQCKKLGIYKWAQLLFALLVKYMGLDDSVLPFPAKGNPDKLMNEIWIGGNFGQIDKRWGDIPSNNIGRKLHTLKQLLYKFHLFVKYAPAESFWSIAALMKIRIKELFQ